MNNYGLTTSAALPNAQRGVCVVFKPANSQRTVSCSVERAMLLSRRILCTSQCRGTNTTVIIVREVAHGGKRAESCDNWVAYANSIIRPTADTDVRYRFDVAVLQYHHPRRTVQRLFIITETSLFATFVVDILDPSPSHYSLHQPTPLCRF